MAIGNSGRNKIGQFVKGVYQCDRTKHGMSSRKNRSLIYRTWGNMRQRCTNPNAPNYKYYGARGIRVCERWNRFENFIEDMGDKPEGMSLDRIDVNGNYEPNNCRWATWKEQRHNRQNLTINNS